MEQIMQKIQKTKKILVMILLFSLIINLSNGYVSYGAETNNIIAGKCGDNVYYELNVTTGILRIYGSGAMADFNYIDYSGCGPWEKEYRSIITKVKIESGVTTVGMRAFNSNLYANQCYDKLTSIEIAATVTDIGDLSFWGCVNLETISLPNSIKRIGAKAFSGKFTELNLPPSIQTIEEEAFSGCHIKYVEIPDNCEVGYEAFAFCDELNNAVFGENCKIDGWVFRGCSQLSQITIGEGSVSVNHNSPGVFEDCTGLQSIHLPDSWCFYDGNEDTYAYHQQFEDCTNLEKISFNPTNKKYTISDGIIYSKDEKELVYYPFYLTSSEYEMPDSITTIAPYAFKNQEHLQHITFSSNINKIGWGAFMYCSQLNNVVLPEGIAELTGSVFWGCTNLESIVLPSTLKNIHSNGKIPDESFDSTTRTALHSIYGEKDSYVEKWTLDNGWAEKKFKETMYCSFDANGGAVNTKRQAVIFGDKYWKLPVPTKGGYQFLGWYTQREQGDKIDSDTVVVEDVSHTLYAHWCTDVTIRKSISNTVIDLETTNYIYDGTEKRPSVNVKDGSVTLTNGVDYTISYIDNIEVGVAKVLITGIGNYTGTVTKIFTINAKIVEKKPFVWGESNWKFDNSNRYFSNYDVNSDVMNKMKNDFNLSNSDIVELKWNIANDNKSGFSGSCFGMTISEIMAHQGDLKLSRYGGNDIVNKNVNTSNMTSVINFIQELQSNSEMCQSIRQTPFLKGDYSQKEFISKLSDVATDLNYLVKLSYKIVTKNTNNGSTNNGYHAVLVYGIEKCNYYSSVTGKTYDRKILIADPNYLSGNIINNNACLYFKSSDSSWIVPYWNKTYSNGSKQSCYWNAENGTSTSNGGIRNIMRYVSLKEEVDLMAEYSAGHYIAGLEIDNISKNVSSVEKVKNSGNPNADYVGDFSEEIVRYDIDMDDDVYITENEELYALWNPTSSYTLSYLKPSDYNLKMDYETVDYYADVTNSTYTLFKPNGSITLRGADASYDITMVTDDSDCVTDWYSVSISGADVNDLVYTKVKNGYTLSASRLENVKISAEGENYAAETIFSTNYDDVFIYEIDKNTIGVAVDTDNNGSYETTIDTKVNSNPTDKPNVITSPMPTNKPSTTTGPTPTEQPNVTENPKPTDVTDTTTNSPLAGTVLKDNKNKVLYKVLAQGETVAFYQVNNKKTMQIVVPTTVTIDGTTYNVTAISDNALSGCKKLKSVTIGKYVTTIGNKAFFKCTSLKKFTIPASVTKIGKKAFYGCKKLKSITIKTQKLKSTSVGIQAFKGIHKKAVINVPKKHKKVYKMWLRKKGITKKMKIK